MNDEKVWKVCRRCLAMLGKAALWSRVVKSTHCAHSAVIITCHVKVACHKQSTFARLDSCTVQWLTIENLWCRPDQIETIGAYSRQLGIVLEHIPPVLMQPLTPFKLTFLASTTAGQSLPNAVALLANLEQVTLISIVLKLNARIKMLDILSLLSIGWTILSAVTSPATLGHLTESLAIFSSICFSHIRRVKDCTQAVLRTNVAWVSYKRQAMSFDCVILASTMIVSKQRNYTKP